MQQYNNKYRLPKCALAIHRTGVALATCALLSGSACTLELDTPIEEFDEQSVLVETRGSMQYEIPLQIGEQLELYYPIPSSSDSGTRPAKAYFVRVEIGTTTSSDSEWKYVAVRRFNRPAQVGLLAHELTHVVQFRLDPDAVLARQSLHIEGYLADASNSWQLLPNQEVQSAGYLSPPIEVGDFERSLRFVLDLPDRNMSETYEISLEQVPSESASRDDHDVLYDPDDDFKPQPGPPTG